MFDNRALVVTPTRSLVLSLVLTASMISACTAGAPSSDDAMAAADDTSDTGSRATGEPVDPADTVEVVDIGRQPRFELRYGLEPGVQVEVVSTDQIQLHQRLIAAAVDDESVPVETEVEATVITNATVTVLDAEPGTGFYVVSTDVTGVEVTDVVPDSAAALLEELTDPGETRTVRRWDRRGRSSPLDGDSGGDLVVFPEEAVGEGGSWTTTHRIVTNDQAREDQEFEHVVSATVVSISTGPDGEPTQVEVLVEGDAGDSEANRPSSTLAGRSGGPSAFSARWTVDLHQPVGVGEMTSSAVTTVDADSIEGQQSTQPDADHVIEQTTRIVSSVNVSTARG